MIFFRKKKEETLAEKFARLLAFQKDMAESTRSSIEEFKERGDIPMVLANFSHLIHDHSDIAVMLWRNGQDPCQSIRKAHKVYVEMISYRSRFDPDKAIQMERIAGITDWDLAYSLFWLVGESETFDFHHPYILSQRYFAYSRFILYRVTGTTIPDPLGAAIEDFRSRFDKLVDRNFRDLLMLLGDEQTDAGIDAIVSRITRNWLRRKNTGFYQAYAPLLAGFHASNDLSVDYQLACILKKNGWQFPDNPHSWRWECGT